MNDLSPGTRVRLVAATDPPGEGLGVLTDETPIGKFAGTLPFGTEGTYRGPHPTLDGWHIVDVDFEDEVGAYVPCGRGHMEVLS